MTGTKKSPFRKLANPAGWLIFFLLFSGCGPSTRDVIGTYHRKTSKGNETLRLNGDQTFVEEVPLASGQKLTTTGSWTLHSRAVRLSSFYLTYDPETQKELDQPQLVNSTDLDWKDGWLVRSEEGPYAFEKARE